VKIVDTEGNTLTLDDLRGAVDDADDHEGHDHGDHEGHNH
jgi:trigger factor